MQEDKLVEEYKEISADSLQEVKDQVAIYFKEKTWFYAVLDFAVGFGIYENGCFFVGIGEQKELQPLDWKYLQEIRVFNRERELRLIPIGETWVGRVRGRMPAGVNADKDLKEYVIDERQKLWGKVKDHDAKSMSDWSLLTSDRGIRIWIPIHKKSKEEVSIWIKKYMRIPTINNPELVYQSDIRIVDFCDWKKDGEGEGQIDE